MNTNYLDIWYLNSVWSLLSSISCGDKISIKGNLVLIEKNHPFLWMKRKFNGNSRSDVFQLIDTLFSMSDYHLKEKENISKSVISFKNNIILGIKGLLNLRETYIDDNRFLSIFNSSLEKMKVLKIYYTDEDEKAKFEELENQIFIKTNKFIFYNNLETNNSDFINDEDNLDINNHQQNNNRVFKSFKNNKN